MQRTRTRIVGCTTASVAAAVMAVGVWFWLTHYLSLAASYCVEARFSHPAADDRPLAGWLRDQAGVLPHTVCVSREGVDGQTVRITFMQVRTAAGSPPLPGLEGACRALGYAGPAGPFLDCKDRYAVQTCCD